MSPPALVSIHDLTPRTLPRVLSILDVLEEAGVPPCTLLVVPGSDWTEDGVAGLRELVSRGHPLAGHGWVHQCGPDRTLFHRLHGLLLSRDQAEHLSRPRDELLVLVRRCFRWFGEAGLPAPELYVPPAWALGRLGTADLRDLPFRRYEVLGGLVHGDTGRTRRLPLVGFEADTRFREVALRAFNALNVTVARRRALPLRISIHPFDLELLLARQLRALVQGEWSYLTEEEALGT